MPISGTALVSGLSRVIAAGKRGAIAGEELQRTRAEQDAERQRNATHSMLEEQLLRGNVSDTATSRAYTTSRRERISGAAAKLRQNPQYKALWDLPDEELVQEAGRLAIERARPSYRNAQDSSAVRHLGAVERQVDDTRADLGAARRAVPKAPILGFQSPADSTKFVGDSTAAAGRVGDLQGRADSLGAVRDSLAAYLEGRPLGPNSGRRAANPAAPAKRRISSDQRDYLQSVGKWDPNRYEVIEDYGPSQ